jgi:hypothetical protein
MHVRIFSTYKREQMENELYYREKHRLVHDLYSACAADIARIMTPKQMARMHEKNTNVECAQVKSGNDGRLRKNRKKR